MFISINGYCKKIPLGDFLKEKKRLKLKYDEGRLLLIYDQPFKLLKIKSKLNKTKKY